MPSFVQDIDKGWKRILRDVKDADKTFVKVGILDSAGSHDGIGMATLGTIHEYGAPGAGIPSRPFMRQTFERIKNQIIRLNKNELGLIFQGKSNVIRSLKKLGVFCQTEIRREFTTGKFEPLKPATIRAKTVGKKKGTTPLIDTGRLRNSINYEIENK